MKRQKGATLIIVMILLIIITGIGTLAIRESLTSLNIATNSQATQLMLQNSDAALFQIENLPESDLALQWTKRGIFGLIQGNNNKGNELIFCFRGDQSDFFDQNKASISKLDASGKFNNSSLGSDGYCKVGKPENYFTSGRQAVMTQISLTYPNTESNDIFGNMIGGTAIETLGLPNRERVIINAVSIMPTLSTASNVEINDCLSQHLNNSQTSNITSCLADLNVPFTTFVAEYVIGPTFTS
ncbi:pilus assembly protein PilX [Acinetobacter stercoris]|uniref:Pilus assembly protein PilX n=1 Tax=Acinetobacter stercoris TaxID=2126983 RepID=A0A2U3MW70_9GAMM|nr:pilus assembly protein PilX [Acinetobacter stercoris]SPL69672.1 hypothetical protein KPC_0850 [Acinetobacter stercoris]